MRKIRIVLGAALLITVFQLTGCATAYQHMDEMECTEEANRDEDYNTDLMDTQENDSVSENMGASSEQLLRSGQTQEADSEVLSSKSDHTAQSEAHDSEANTNAGEGESDTQTDQEEERELTEQEVKQLSRSVRSSDNGFFVCTYYRPEEIDWEQVFYNGAGVGMTLTDEQMYELRVRLTEEEAQKNPQPTPEPTEGEEGEEGEEVQEAEPELIEIPGLTVVSLNSIKSFVKSRTGIDYSEMRKPVEWPEFSRNIFYLVHGDSNYTRIELLSGTVKGTEYRIYYRYVGRNKSKDPEYVMTARIEKGRWTFISNLPVDAVEPITMLDVDFYMTRQEIQKLPVKKIYDFSPKVSEDEEDDKEQEKKNTYVPKGKTPVPCWAVITARYDNTRICFERSFQDDDISEKLLAERFFIPAGELDEITLRKGEQIAVRAEMQWLPDLRIRAVVGNFSGAYSFGGENHLQRMTKEGLNLSTYVVGYDLDGEGRGTHFKNDKEFLQFLEGTWVYYDSTFGEYSAVINFDKDRHMNIYCYGQDFKIDITKYKKVYVGEDAAPDVMTLRVNDDVSLQKMGTMFYYWKRDLGDYRIRVVQMDGEQILLLSQESNGQDKLYPFFSGADELTEEYAFYRFIGTGTENEEEIKKQEEDSFKG